MSFIYSVFHCFYWELYLGHVQVSALKNIPRDWLSTDINIFWLQMPIVAYSDIIVIVLWRPHISQMSIFYELRTEVLFSALWLCIFQMIQLVFKWFIQLKN